MLPNYAEVERNTTQPLPTYSNQEYLHLSYDLNNYHSLLTHISEVDDSRWILFVAPPGKPNVNFLAQAGINKNRIIMLPQNKIDDADELLKRALESNNYATVVTWSKHCGQSIQKELQLIAKKNQTHCFIYCTQ